MRRIFSSAVLAGLLSLAVSAHAGPEVLCCDCDGAPDTDGDTVGDCADNCSMDVNPGQDDTDGDFCGNVCDADYDQSGGPVGIADFGGYAARFGTFDLLADHTEPVDGPVGIADFGHFVLMFGSPAGPSGTTPGTLACP